jgi:phytoene dehydrogenase-like protein
VPKPDEATPTPVRPPTLPPDFPDIPQNSSSELQPPPDQSATPDKVAGTTPASGSEMPEVGAKAELRNRNARLREKINSVLEQHPELRDATEELALEQGLHVEVGVSFLERTNGKLQERARAIIERRPDLERLFDD